MTVRVGVMRGGRQRHAVLAAMQTVQTTTVADTITSIRKGTASKHHAQHDTVLPTTPHPSNRARKHTHTSTLSTELFQLTSYKPF